jgi:hypothetical protein
VPTTSTAQQPKLEAESLQQQQPQLEPPQQQQGNGSHHKIEANASSHASHAIPQGAPQGAGDAGACLGILGLGNLCKPFCVTTLYYCIALYGWTSSSSAPFSLEGILDNGDMRTHKVRVGQNHT